MPIGFADNVGLRSGSRTTDGDDYGALSPKRALETIKELVNSPQFRDGVRLFAIGAAVSASKVVFDALLATVRRIFVGQAVFRGRDEAYRWILLYMVSLPSFRQSPRAVEISSRPTLLLDYGADYRGELNEDEIRAAWSGLQGRESEELEKAGHEEKESDADVTTAGVHFFPATGESVSFTFEGTRFWASRTRELVGDESWEESVQVSYLSFSSTPLRRLVKQAKEQYKQRSKGRVTVHRLDRYGNWYEAAGIAKRSAESIHLPGNVKYALLDDAKRFLHPSTRQWYGDRGIPYRRGYLFFGTPGSGKSSLCHVLASEVERPIYTLNLAAASLNDETLLERMGQVPGGALLLIEDVDAAFIDRTQERPQEGKQKSGVSFSTLLNALDGVGAAEGRLLCMTTNHPDRLDAALVRPGRVDEKFEFGYATSEQARELFLHWYMPRGRSVEGEPRIDEVRAYATEFARQIVPNTVSVAALQGFLLSCGQDHQQAAQQVGDFFLLKK